MKIIHKLLCIALISITAISQTHQEDNTIIHQHTNSLINESSPYLLQHAHNPVNWYPWGTEAFERAKSENKLIIISIGYAACHWCHVMEHESFSDIDIAKFMNDNFIAIKVDREERPDIDQVYMDAVQLITGSGGWPLNCIALPDGRPIYGGTYFSKEQWHKMLNSVLQFVKDNPEKAEEQAESLTAGIQSDRMDFSPDSNSEFELIDTSILFENIINTIDYVNGGFKQVPKFPTPINFQFLLNYNFLTGNSEAQNAVTTTLDKIANGGIYDQIGGGFARYSTDAVWKVPHFEKMLYDNAQLVSLYSNAFQHTKNPNYKTIVMESLEFIENEMTSENGGFYSSLDADSEGEEGKFYIWTTDEIYGVLGKDADLIINYYNATENGNWENGKNILFKILSDDEFILKKNITNKELNTRLYSAKQKLLKVRNKRIRPALDDKILTSWNALMLKAYIDAYRAFNEDKYLDIAKNNADFIITNLISSDSRLDRKYKNGKSSINGFLDDYAFTIEGFISLYQATFNEEWLIIANKLCNYSIEHFLDKNNGMFYYTSDLDSKLFVRKKEISDSVIPSSNSQMAKNLFVLGHYFYNEEYINISKRMMNNIKESAMRSPSAYSNWNMLLLWLTGEVNEVAIVGDNYINKRKEFDNYYLPNVFLAGGKTEGNLSLLKGKLINNQTTIYVCQNKACVLPVTEVKEALKQLK